MTIFVFTIPGSKNNIFEFLAFPPELLPSDSTEDALQKVCALSVDCTVKAGYREGLTFLYQGGCKLQRSAFQKYLTLS